MPQELFEYTMAVYTGYSLEYIREEMSNRDHEIFTRLSMMNFISDSITKSVSAGLSGGMLGAGSGKSAGRKNGKRRTNYIPTAEEMKKDNENPNVAYARNKGAKK